ncbi:3-hydroxyacyl-CoA dehydrogenase [Marinobacter daqiaonensis]|uniref:3-hydroxyacyl-CoA dehydrogenase n=1 Tax=Marinobacter daqiaonensis TaxID=650891 RepID=A0A1I6I720_9GAMM|nr:3-hydroxyacyl-CoA dehydrogenase [Marinobacter daqiaonensis]
MTSPQDHYTPEQQQALEHVKQAEQEASNIPGISPDIQLRPIRKVAVIGAGTMGGGIAMNYANAGIPVVMLELRQAALDKGLDIIRKNYQRTVSKGRLSQEDMDQRMALLSGTLSYDDLGDVDLVVEAVFESMDIKKKVFNALDQVCKPGTILATNTSNLDVDEIAASISRPQDVIGLHFFSPANIMKLLEVVRGKKTADDVLATCLDMAKNIRKVAVVSGVCFGFIGNRMLEPYAREAHRLVLEGATPAQVDAVMTSTGLAMGVLAMYDMAGIDVGYMVRQAHPGDIGRDPSFFRLADELYHMDRYGQKTGRGFYIYEDREKKEDPEVNRLAEEIAADLGIKRREISNEEIHDRCLYMLINEGIQILDEGIALRSGDIDLVWIYGYGFPAWLGGPMHYAEQIGLEKILETIRHYRDTLGDYGKMWFEPAPLLEKLVAEGRNRIEKI